MQPRLGNAGSFKEGRTASGEGVSPVLMADFELFCVSFEVRPIVTEPWRHRMDRPVFRSDLVVYSVN